jgi:hypothetical protein
VGGDALEFDEGVLSMTERTELEGAGQYLRKGEGPMDWVERSCCRL